jgi:peroxiredoxin
MEALPFIKKLRNDYSENKLEIIGINRDLSFKGLQNTVTNKKIKWRNIWDENDAITNLFGVTAIPTTILINKEGIIIYRGTGITAENEEEILEVLNKNL